MNVLILKHSGRDRRASTTDVRVPFVHYPYFLSRALGGKNFGNIGNDLTFTSGAAGNAAIDAVAFAQAPWLAGDAAGPNYYCVAGYDAGEATETELLDMLDFHGRGAVLGFMRIKPANIGWTQQIFTFGQPGGTNNSIIMAMTATSSHLTIQGRGSANITATNFQALTAGGGEHRIVFLLDGINGSIQSAANGSVSSEVALAGFAGTAEVNIREQGVALTINEALGIAPGSRATVVGSTNMLANHLRDVALFNVTAQHNDVADNLASIAAWWERTPAGYLPRELASLLV